MKHSILTLKDVSVAFKKETPFFKGLSLSLPPKKMLFLRGKNGAGKSTLLGLLQGKTACFEQVSGTLILGDSILALHKSLPAEHPIFDAIALVPQKFDEALAPDLSFEQNLAMASLSCYPGLQELPAYKQLPSFIDRFALDITKPVRFLSGGQRQVLSILMALQKNRLVLLLDEPTAALDEKNADMVMQFLASLVEECAITVLIVCHDRELLQKYAVEGYFELEVDDLTGLRSLDKRER